MKKLLILLALFVLAISVNAQISIDSAKAMLARVPYHVIGGGLQIRVKDTCQHIWVDVVSDTVTNHKPPLFTYPVGLPPPKEWQNGNEIVCLLCKHKKKKVIHNVGFGDGNLIPGSGGSYIFGNDSTILRYKKSHYATW